MFEVAELGHKLGKDEFSEKVPALHTALLEAQRALRDSKHPVIIIVAGVEGAGKGELVNRLSKWLDSRGIRTTAFWDETDEQAMRPRYWRFWRAMPPRGSVGIMIGAWYAQPITQRAFGRIDEAEFERRLREIAELEQLLTSDGAVIIKLWLHLTQDKVRKQLKVDARRRGEKTGSDPITRKYSRQFEAFLQASETAIRSTDTGTAPWHVIEAADAQYRDFCAGQIILDTLRATLDQDAAAKAAAGKRKHSGRQTTAPALVSDPGRSGRAGMAEASPELAAGTSLTVLDKVDLGLRLDEKRYRASLHKWQAKLQLLTWQARKQQRSVVIVFEGWDAAGKGSTIHRLTQAIDARLFQVISIAAPTDEELAQHYLWRFWRHLPMAGYLTIYDRSWYGRVLVERVEQLAEPDDWQRGYAEINLFEQQLCEHGIIVLKFWLHLSPEEQLRRFKEREQTPWKQYKITQDDWRNRDRWNDYLEAVNDMVAHTSTTLAPWHLVPAEDKKYGRIDVLRTVCRTLKKALKQ